MIKRLAVVGVLLAAWTSAAEAAEIKILSAGAMKTSLSIRAG